MKAEPKTLQIDEFGGLEIGSNRYARSLQSFSTLEGFDLVTPGAIRKAKGLSYLLDDQGKKILNTFNIREFRSYRRTPDDPLLVLGIDNKGLIWNVLTGVVLGQTDPGNTALACTRPFAAVLQTTGLDLTVVQPDPPESAPPITAPINSLFYNTDDGRLWRWDSSLISATECGCPAPKHPPVVGGFIATSDPAKGQAQIITSRKYQFTYFNPATLEESSPTLEPTATEVAYPVVPGNFAPGFPYLASLKLSISGIPKDAWDRGFTSVRIYITRDGSDTYFLARDLNGFANSGVPAPGTPISNAGREQSDIPMLHVPGFGSFSASIYDGTLDPLTLLTETFHTGIISSVDAWAEFGPHKTNEDQALVDPAPRSGENDPPPLVEYGATYQGRLYLVDKAEQATLRFSKIDEWAQFPTENYITFGGDQYDPINTLADQYQELIVGKEHGMSRLTGNDFTDFVVTPLDKQIGMSSKRCWIDVQGSLLFWSDQGVMKLSGDVSQYIGAMVRPLTDSVSEESRSVRLLGAVDSKLGIAVFAYKDPNGVGSSLLLIDFSQKSPFSKLGDNSASTTLDPIVGMNEVELPDGEKAILVGFDGSGVRRLFYGEGFDYALSPTDQTVLPWRSVAETQLFPIPGPVSYRSNYRRLYVQGDALNEFQYQASYDDGETYSPPRTLSIMNFLGLSSESIRIRFIHSQQPGNDGPNKRPEISGMRILYSELGEVR